MTIEREGRQSVYYPFSPLPSDRKTIQLLKDENGIIKVSLDAKFIPDGVCDFTLKNFMGDGQHLKCEGLEVKDHRFVAASKEPRGRIHLRIEVVEGE